MVYDNSLYYAGILAVYIPDGGIKLPRPSRLVIVVNLAFYLSLF